MSRLQNDTPIRWLAIALTGFALSGCATSYTNRADETDAPLRGLAVLSGMATSVPEPEEFVKESRPETLSYIPIGIRPEAPDGQSKVLTPEELLLLKKKLEAAQQQNSGIVATE